MNLDCFPSSQLYSGNGIDNKSLDQFRYKIEIYHNKCFTAIILKSQKLYFIEKKFRLHLMLKYRRTFYNIVSKNLYCKSTLNNYSQSNFNQMLLSIDTLRFFNSFISWYLLFYVALL